MQVIQLLPQIHRIVDIPQVMEQHLHLAVVDMLTETIQRILLTTEIQVLQLHLNNGAAAYQAQVIASNRIAAYDNALLSERAAKNEGYLKKTTIYPGEVITGYINIGRKKGTAMTINVNINGAIYEFPWNIGK